MKTNIMAFFVLAIMTTFANAGSNPDTWKYVVSKSDTSVKRNEVVKLITNKQIRVGAGISRNLTMGNRGKVYDKYGKIRPHSRWTVTKNGVLCLVDKTSNYASCYKVVRNKGKLFLAGTKRRFRLWLKEGKTS